MRVCVGSRGPTPTCQRGPQAVVTAAGLIYGPAGENPANATQHRPFFDHPYGEPAAPGRPDPGHVRQGGRRSGRASGARGPDQGGGCGNRPQAGTAGVDLVNDGEMSKPSYATYVKDRL